MVKVDIIKEKNKPYVFAISGVKNSGKTTYITKLIPLLKAKGYTVATIKHDGHDFTADVANTDTYKHRSSGADGVAIFSKNKYMIINQKPLENPTMLIEHFKDYDIVILEGFKQSHYPKIELVRKGNSSESICNKDTIIAVATDIEDFSYEGNIININSLNSAIELIEKDLLEVRR